jgi:hypothetical protein
MEANIIKSLHPFWGGVFSPMTRLNPIEWSQMSSLLDSTGLERKKTRQREGSLPDVETSIAGNFRSEIQSGIQRSIYGSQTGNHANPA